MPLIQVTEKLIKAGCRGSNMECPIALAIQPHLRSDEYVKVSPYSVSVYDAADQRYCEFALPTIAKAFIVMFDRGETVKPFSFQLDLR